MDRLEKIRSCVQWISFCVTLCVVAGCQTSPEYDLVLRGGNIYDGSGATPYVGDVAIQGDRIAALATLVMRAREPR